MRSFPSDCQSSICEPLLERGRLRPRETAVIFIDEEGETETLAVGTLLARAGACARELTHQGLKPGDLILLSLGHCRELLYAFWGVQLVGAVPMILPYKSPLSTQASHSQRLLSALRQTGARLLVTQPGQAAALASELKDPETRVLSTDDLVAAAGSDALHGFAAAAGPPAAAGEGIAYIQFTSGTTGSQKMVELSHWAIMKAVESYKTALRMGPSDVVVNWLPLYHDFGLFAGFMLPLFSSIPTVLISPYKWLRDPLFVLKAVQKYRGTITFFPNSAHNHTVRCTAGLAPGSLDLSSLRLLINGSEPILHESQQNFFSFFSAYGLRECALASGYGMAENTLGVKWARAARWIGLIASECRQPGKPCRSLLARRGALRRSARETPCRGSNWLSSTGGGARSVNGVSARSLSAAPSCSAAIAVSARRANGCWPTAGSSAATSAIWPTASCLCAGAARI